MCGEQKEGSARAIEKLAHTWDNGRVTVAATYDAVGIRTYACTVCGETKTEEIPALKKSSIFTSVKKTFKAAKLKKQAQNIALPKVSAKFGTAKWKVSSKDKKKVLTLKNGKIQVKKGAKKGSYSIKLKASATKAKNYKAATTKVVSVKVTVK